MSSTDSKSRSGRRGNKKWQLKSDTSSLGASTEQGNDPNWKDVYNLPDVDKQKKKLEFVEIWLADMARERDLDLEAQQNYRNMALATLGLNSKDTCCSGIFFGPQEPPEDPLFWQKVGVDFHQKCKKYVDDPAADEDRHSNASMTTHHGKGKNDSDIHFDYDIKADPTRFEGERGCDDDDFPSLQQTTKGGKSDQGKTGKGDNHKGKNDKGGTSSKGKGKNEKGKGKGKGSDEFGVWVQLTQKMWVPLLDNNQSMDILLDRMRLLHPRADEFKYAIDGHQVVMPARPSMHLLRDLGIRAKPRSATASVVHVSAPDSVLKH